MVVKELESAISRKLHEDFAKELKVSEQAIDLIADCTQIVKGKSQFLNREFNLDELVKADATERCNTVNIMLLMHSVMNINASRQILLTGYLVPSMSSLRIAYEALQEAMICSQHEEEALKFVQGKAVDKRLTVLGLKALVGDELRTLKGLLSYVGVHPNFFSLQYQAIFEGAIFDSGNKKMYEYHFQRCLYMLFAAQFDVLTYFLTSRLEVVKEVPRFNEVFVLLRRALYATHSEVERKAKALGMIHHELK